MHAIRATLLLASLACASGGVCGSEDRAPDIRRQAELVHLLKHDCGACHGMRLKGGLGPPLEATSLAAKPDALLVATVLSGRPGTPMPPWRGLVTEAEARWMVRYLKGMQP